MGQNRIDTYIATTFDSYLDNFGYVGDEHHIDFEHIECDISPGF